MDDERVRECVGSNVELDVCCSDGLLRMSVCTFNLKGSWAYSSMTQLSLFILIMLFSDQDIVFMNAPEPTSSSMVFSPNSRGR